MIGWFYLSYTNYSFFVVFFFFKCTVQSSDTKQIFKTDDDYHKVNLKLVYLIPLNIYLKLFINSILV